MSQFSPQKYLEYNSIFQSSLLSICLAFRRVTSLSGWSNPASISAGQWGIYFPQSISESAALILICSSRNQPQ